MLKSTKTLLLLSLLLMVGCESSQMRLEISSFIDLLVRRDEPSIAEYAKFSGGSGCGGESELEFEQRECVTRGWNIDSESCIAFTRQKCELREHEPSLKLRWLRKRFATVGKKHRWLEVKAAVLGERVGHTGTISQVEVKIGKYNFLLFHDGTSYPIADRIVAVSEVDGKGIEEYLDVDSKAAFDLVNRSDELIVRASVSLLNHSQVLQFENIEVGEIVTGSIGLKRFGQCHVETQFASGKKMIKDLSHVSRGFDYNYEIVVSSEKIIVQNGEINVSPWMSPLTK